MPFIAVRVQLSGCYLRYEVVGFKQVAATQLLYKVCRARRIVDGGRFKARRDATFGMVENGVQSRVPWNKLRISVATLFLRRFIFIIVTSVTAFTPTEFPPPLLPKVGFVLWLFALVRIEKILIFNVCLVGSEGGGHPHTERTVALAVGGVAALGFLIVCMLFLKLVLKRRGGKR
ncbi:hypothetical protein V8G54_010789 [Vigna mungo]|uniref:Transmembrane protein n=1 Tax=Vigna mungo TaxID=3915 RepID=A0AAQ3S573_VIGMU